MICTHAYLTHEVTQTVTTLIDTTILLELHWTKGRKGAEMKRHAITLNRKVCNGGSEALAVALHEATCSSYVEYSPDYMR